MVTRRSFLHAGAALGIGALTSSALAACSGVAGGGGGGGSQNIQVDWWGGSDRVKRTQNVIALFKQSHPSVNVSASFSDINSYFEKLNTQAAGGGLPDVVQLGGGYVPQYMHKGQLLDLTDLVNKGTIDIGDYDQSQINQGKVNDRLYAVSIGGNMPAVIYNKTMIEKAGMQPPADDLTWDAFASYVADLGKKLPPGTYAIDHYNGPMFDVWMRQLYPESYTPDNKQPSYTVTDVQNYFQYWENLRRAGLNVPGDIVAAEIQNSSPNTAPIVLGKCAMMTNWTNFVSQYQILMKDELAMTRCPSGGKQAGDYVQASQFFSIAATSKQAEVSAQFINFFNHDPAALKILGVERGVPASAKSRDLVKPSLAPYDQLQVQFLSDYSGKARATTQLQPSNGTDIGKALAREEQSIALSGVSVADAAKKFMQDAEKELAS
jgi:multiple sugar transport system substrate-binding protein